MGFTFDTSVPAITVFMQGLLSFLSPCILPLLPLYISYLAGGTKTTGPDGSIQFPRKKVLFHTLFFILGISATFFLLGFGFTALGQFFNHNRIWFARISGFIMILFGIYQLGLLGQSNALAKERRLPFRLDKMKMGPLTAFLLGFTFSFSWTPCVGPILGSVLLMAGSSGSSALAFLLIGVYTAGFVLPFLAVGFFTGKLLNFFTKNKNIVKYTVKIGAILMIVMGIMTLTGFMNGFTNYLSNTGGNSAVTDEKKAETPKDSPAASEQPIPAIDFSLSDQFGNTHSLSDYKGKTIFLNFWATWCPPCKGEMPHIQDLYEEYGLNENEVVILGIAAPNYDREGSAEDVAAFLTENEYTFPVVMDEGGDIFSQYGIRAYPTTVMIDKDGNIFGAVESALTKDNMKSIIKQTMEGR